MSQIKTTRRARNGFASSVLIAAGYNNNVAGIDNANVVYMSGAYATTTSIVTSFSKAGRRTGDVVEVINIGGTFTLMGENTLNGLVAASLATAPNATSCGIAMTSTGDGISQPYMTFVKGEGFTMVFDGTVWRILTRTFLPYLGSRKGVRACGVSGASTGANSHDVQSGVNGTGASVFGGFSTPSTNDFNSSSATCGTTATGSVYLWNALTGRSLNFGNIAIGTNTMLEIGFTLNPSAAPSAAQNYTLRFGLMSNTTGVSTTPLPTITEGAYCEFTFGAAAAVTLKTVKASVVTTSATFPNTPSITAYTHWKISFDGVNIVVTYNGAFQRAVALSAVTLNGTANGLHQVMHLAKTVGTTAVNLAWKSMEYEQYNSAV